MKHLKSSFRKVTRFSCYIYPACYMTIWWISFWNSTSYRDFSTAQTLHHFYDLDTELGFEWITRGIHVAFTTGMRMPVGNVYLSGQLVPSFFFGLAYVLTVGIIAMIFSNFSPCISLGTSQFCFPSYIKRHFYLCMMQRGLIQDNAIPSLFMYCFCDVTFQA